MKNRIENPKVFISYAWGTDEYQSKVLSFATDLVNDGIDVVLDKWDLSEGNDTFNFMEKCVTDNSITNVLMLLDPVYSKKADIRQGGVGAETQIISTEVYNKVEQNKFIPVVFERNDTGDICKPIYLKSKLHFDLSQEEVYDKEYKRLVMRLFGRETYPKPELGKKPVWVDSPQTISIKTTTKYDVLKQNDLPNVKKDLFFHNLENIKESFIKYASEKFPKSSENDEYIKTYEGMQQIRNNYLALLSNYTYVNDSITMVADFLEELCNIANSSHDLMASIQKVWIHELFIYTIAVLFKRKDYVSSGYLLGKTYFNNRKNTPETFDFFYSAFEQTNLDKCIKQRDNKNYYSGTAKYWVVDTLADNICSKKELVLADLMCYNYALLGINHSLGSKWFPVLYVYGGGFDYSDDIHPIALRMQSQEYLSKLIAFFGYSNMNDFITKYREVEDSKDLREYRYNGVFHPAPALVSIVKSDKLGLLP